MVAYLKDSLCTVEVTLHAVFQKIKFATLKKFVFFAFKKFSLCYIGFMTGRPALIFVFTVYKNV